MWVLLDSSGVQRVHKASTCAVDMCSARSITADTYVLCMEQAVFNVDS